jgi:S1-C subfamily serine protease
MTDQYPSPRPYGPFAQPPFAATPPPQPVPPHRTRRLLATVTATALVAGVGGVGAGYALGHGFSGGSTQASSGTNGQSNVSTDGSGGTTTIPGNGGWTWSGGSGGIIVPSDPFGDSSGGTGGSDPSAQSPGSSTDSTAQASGSQLTGLVRIVSRMKYAGGEAAGTGMVLTSDGEVVTNHHVVAGATSVQVKVMSTGTTYTAKVVGTDSTDDVAVLQLVGASGLSTVTPDTDGIAVGDAVTAVGDANGTVGYLSAATGSVVAENQTITTQSEANVAGQRLRGLLQISSDVISGDSGGATYDADGQVVGMTTAASSGSSDVVGYAVPIAKVLRIVHDLDSGVAKARYDYGYPAFLGVGLGQTGTAVQGVFEATPAAEAGIAAGDTITAIDGTPVDTSAALRSAVAAHSPGESVSVTWTDAAGASHTASLTLIDGPVA